MKKNNEDISYYRESEAPCRSCYYQEVSVLGRICQHKRSMEGTEAEAEYDFCNEIKSCNFYIPYKDMEDTYYIDQITDKDGNEKKFGRYQLRKGRLCKRPIVNQYKQLYIYYLENEDGSDYAGKVLLTSEVISQNETDDELIFETQNSIYHFKKNKVKNNEDKNSKH